MLAFTPKKALAETNLRNGDFSEDLESWFIVPKKGVGATPFIGISEDKSGNPYLFIDTPAGSWVWVYQVFDLPEAPLAVLRFKVWGNVDPVDVEIIIVVIVNNTNSFFYTIDEFDPAGKIGLGGVPTTKTYDITQYVGNTVALLFNVTSHGMISSTANFDDVQVEVALGRNSIITCNIEKNPICIGEKVVVSGEIFPPPHNVTFVELLYSRYDDSHILRRVIVDTSGHYRDEFYPDTPGVWTLVASWSGDIHYDGATCNSKFLVSTIPGIFSVDGVITINGTSINLYNEEVEALAGESISGELLVRSIVMGRWESVPVVAITSWERDRWDLLLFQIGTPTDQYGFHLDPFGIKFVISAPRIVTKLSPRVDKGAFIKDYRWQFPMPRETPNEVSENTLYLASEPPNFKLPNKNGVYYIVLLHLWFNSAQDIVYPPNRVSPFNETVDSIWDVNPMKWENYRLDKRNNINGTWALAIPIIVIEGVDVAITNATNIINTAKMNKLLVKDAEDKLNEARKEYEKRHFSKAKELALEAWSLANTTLINYSSQTLKNFNESEKRVQKLSDWAFNLYFAKIVYLDVSHLRDLLEQAKEEITHGNFAAAQNILRDLNTYADRQETGITTIIILSVIVCCILFFYVMASLKVSRLPPWIEQVIPRACFAIVVGALWVLFSWVDYALFFLGMVISIMLCPLLFFVCLKILLTVLDN